MSSAITPATTFVNGDIGGEFRNDENRKSNSEFRFSLQNSSTTTTTSRSNTTIVTGEISIPTTFGVIAAKTWGIDAPDRLRVLAVHGWSDNAGTFDRLFPILPNLDQLYIVAIDLPGHGASSHLPRGVPYTDLTWVIEIKRTLDYLRWTPTGVTIIAHSMGAVASLELAALYPDLVRTLVMLDTVKLRCVETRQLADEMANAIAHYNSVQRNAAVRIGSARSSMSYDLERSLDMIVTTHTNGRLTRDAARCLMQRAVDRRNNRFTFRRDPRLNCPIYHKRDFEQLQNYLADIRCRLLIIRARGTHHTLRCPYDSDMIELYRERCDEFRYVEVDGDHYVHLTQPKNISDIICSFLQPSLDALPQNRTEEVSSSTTTTTTTAVATATTAVETTKSVNAETTISDK